MPHGEPLASAAHAGCHPPDGDGREGNHVEDEVDGAEEVHLQVGSARAALSGTEAPPVCPAAHALVSESHRRQACQPHLFNRLWLVLQVHDDLHDDEEEVDEGQDLADLQGGLGMRRNVGDNASHV